MIACQMMMIRGGGLRRPTLMQGQHHQPLVRVGKSHLQLVRPLVLLVEEVEVLEVILRRALEDLSWEK